MGSAMQQCDISNGLEMGYHSYALAVYMILNRQWPSIKKVMMNQLKICFCVVVLEPVKQPWRRLVNNKS